MGKVLDVWVRTGHAARIIGISRPVLVKMLEKNAYSIRWRRAEGHYREVFYPDVLAYRQRADAEREAAYAASEG